MMPALGAMLAPRHWGDPEALPELVAAAAACRELGWSVLVPEHARRPGYPPSALALTGWLLGVLPGLHAGAVVISAARDPVSLVRDLRVLAAAAALHGGRVRLGLVAGYDPADLPAKRFERRYAALDQAIEHAAASGGRPWQVLVGAGSERGLRRAARADGWLAGTQQSTARLGALCKHFRATGGDTVVAIRRWVDTPGPGLLDAVALPAGTRTPPEVLVGGDAATVRARLEEVAAAGVDEILLGPLSDAAGVQRVAEATGSR